jgi:hypothetical protein
MKTACLFLVLVAACLYTPAEAEGKRMSDSLAVDAASASPETEAAPPRDAATGQASGKRVATGDVDGDGMTNEAAVSSPRDAASGQATGRRQHKPSVRSAAASDETGTEGAAAEKTKPTKSSSYDLKTMKGE